MAKALEQKHKVETCKCGGPLIWSLSRPVANCFACGMIVKADQAARPERKWKCEKCGGFFRSRVGHKHCPDCKSGKKDEGQRAKWREQGRAYRARLAEKKAQQKA